MIDENIPHEERGSCFCIGCRGIFVRGRRGGELVLVCSHCAIAVEAPFLDETSESEAKRRRR